MTINKSEWELNVEDGVLYLRYKADGMHKIRNVRKAFRQLAWYAFKLGIWK